MSPGCYGAEEPHFSLVTIHRRSSIPRLKDKGTFSLQTGLSAACGAAKAGGCELKRSQKTFRKVCHEWCLSRRSHPWQAQAAGLETMRHHAREARSLTEELMHQPLLLTP